MSSEEATVHLSMLFSAWETKERVVKLKLITFRAGKKSWRALPFIKTMDQVPAEAKSFGDEGVPGTVFTYDRKSGKPSQLSVQLPEDAGESVKLAAHCLSNDVLPLLLVPLPADAELKPGLKWGKPHKDDGLACFDSKPDCTEWRVLARPCRLADRNTVLVESTVFDVGRIKNFGNNSVFRRKSVHYDWKAGRVRNATETYIRNGGFGEDERVGHEHDYHVWFVNEVPGVGGPGGLGPTLPEIRKLQPRPRNER
jgi:hypothetical protein